MQFYAAIDNLIFFHENLDVQIYNSARNQLKLNMDEFYVFYTKGKTA